VAWATSPRAVGHNGAVSNGRLGGLACAVLAAGGLGVGNELTSGDGRPGFMVGLNDHVVLTPYGINRADPTAFAGDWFTREAPQPHWLFDAVVWAGRSAGNLPVALLLYYVVALGVFGVATALLARRWCGGTPWLAGLASLTVGLLSAYQAVYLAGTNTLNSPLALPNVLGGALGYLFLAAALTRRRWAPAVLPVAAAAHIQMGVLALGAGALVWGFDVWRSRAWLRTRPGPARRGLAVPAAWWVLGALVALGGMRARSVGSDPAAFVEICDRYIPFHCAARSWSLWQLLSTVAAAGLCLLLAAALPGGRGGPRRYLLAVGVPAVLLVLAMAADRRGVPVLGRAVQAYNAYRVGNLIFPFAVWGVLTPVLVLVGRGRRIRSGTGVLARVTAGVLAAVCALATTVFYTSPGVPAGMKTGFVADRRLTAAALVTLVVLVAVLGVAAVVGSGRSAPVRRRCAGSVLAVLAVGGLLVVRSAGFTGAVPAPLSWPASAAEGAWGARARAVLAPDVQVLLNPARPQLKLALERGVVVDCKDLPYGGAAYREWTARLDALGGWAQCASYSPAAYDGLSGAALDAAARRYGAKAIVVAHREGESSGQAAELVARGYRLHRVSADGTGLDTDVLVR
jgi:hypothetical protein